jgi:hypothetical protein
VKLTPTEKLVLTAHRHNWDEGTGPLKKILANPDCGLGTALLIYWRGRPEYYRQWAVADVPRSDRAFEIVQLAEKGILSGKYQPLIRVDPSEEVGLYREQPVVRNLPTVVYQPSEGTTAAADLIEGRRGEGAFLTAAAAGNLELVKQMLQANPRRSTLLS